MAGVAQLGEQQTEAWAERDLLRLQSILEVPCSIHGPGIFATTDEDSKSTHHLKKNICMVSGDSSGNATQMLECGLPNDLRCLEEVH